MVTTVSDTPLLLKVALQCSGTIKGKVGEVMRALTNFVIYMYQIMLYT